MNRLRGELRVSTPVMLIILAILGWLIRAWAARQGYFGYDLHGFTEWMRALGEHPWSEFYSLPLQVPPDHLPGTLWMLAGAGEIQRAMGLTDTFALFKNIGITADVATGVMVYFVARCVADTRPSLMASAAYLLNPAPIFIAGFWGQWDGLSLGLLLASLALSLRGRPVLGLVLVTLSMLFKPQFALIGLLIAVFIVVNRFRRTATSTTDAVPLRTRLVHALSPIAGGLIASVALVSAAGYPFGVALIPGINQWTYLERVRFAIERYDSTSSGALGIWLLSLGTSEPPSDQSYLVGVLTYSMVGTGLTAVAGVIALMLLNRYQFSAPGLLLSSGSLLWAFSIFGTRLHERYFLPVVAMLIIASAAQPVLRPLAALISLVCFGNLYLAFSYHDWSLPLASWRTGSTLSVLSLIAVLGWVIFVALAWSGAQQRKTSAVPARPLVARPSARGGAWEATSVSRSAD